MHKLTLALLFLYAFAVPWEYSLDLGEPLGNVARLLGLLMLLAIVPLILQRRQMRTPGLLQWLVLALNLYFMCSYFWTIDALTTLDKMRAYVQVMMVVWITWEVAETPGHLRGLLRAFVAGCGVLAVLTVVSYASASAAAVEQIRFVAEGHDPNDVARFLDLGFPLATLLFAVEEAWLVRLLAIAYLPLGLMAVLLTASRGGFSASLAALLCSAILLLNWRPRAASLIFAGLAVTAGLLWLFVPTGSLDRLATIPEQINGGNLNDRLKIWMAGWHAFARAPWWGYGAGTYTSATGLAPGDTAHNTMMAVVVTGGLAALGVFTALLGAVVRALSRTSGLLRIALGSTLVVWAITSTVGSVEENRITWLLFAIVAVAGRLAMEQPVALAEAFSDAEVEQTVRALHAVG